MNRRLWIFLLGSGLVSSGLIGLSGCSEDAAQPARESISVPRKGGGAEDTGPVAKGKSAGTLGKKGGM